jgi:hypothetical protein
MARAAAGEITCVVCGKPNLKIIGTVTVMGKGVSGDLHLTSHRNDETGKTCKGMTSRELFSLVMRKARGW